MTVLQEEIQPIRFFPVKDSNIQGWAIAKSTSISDKLPARHSEVMELINALLEECGQDDWDSEGSLAINRTSRDFATHFLLYRLPTHIPLPALWCEPNGRVAGEWLGKNRSAAIVFKPEREYLVVGYNKHQKDFFEKTDDYTKAVNFIQDLLY